MAYDKNGSTRKPRKKVRTTSGDYEDTISMGELSTWIFSGLLIIIALAILIAYTSNIFITPGESNWLGLLGSWIVEHVIEYSFGLATVFLPILMIALAFRILKIGHIRLWKWIINCCLLTIWFSVAAELFQRFFFTESHILMGYISLILFMFGTVFGSFINCMAGISLNADKADVNGDGSIDVGDIMAIINKMAGL